MDRHPQAAPAVALHAQIARAARQYLERPKEVCEVISPRKAALIFLEQHHHRRTVPVKAALRGHQGMRRGMLLPVPRYAMKVTTSDARRQSSSSLRTTSSAMWSALTTPLRLLSEYGQKPERFRQTRLEDIRVCGLDPPHRS